jgi:formate hydrogenlyase subunit 3/multisubunit Na+/H+ antiporter MnhD subunit
MMEVFSLEVLLLFVIFSPFLLFCGFLAPNWRQALTLLAPWTALPALLMAVLMSPGVSVKIPWMLLETGLGMDATGRVFLGFTALIWFIAGIYALAYLREKKGLHIFFIFYLLALCGNLGLILAQDLVGFAFFFALMSFSAYGLVVHAGTPAAHFAGKIYIVLVILGEILIFTGFVMAANAAGSIYFTDLPARIADSPSRDLMIGLLLLGLGIKAGALPLHVWLPLAHPVAPTPASTVLSACMIKAGLLGWLRVLPLGEMTVSGWGDAMIIAGFLAAFYGVVVGLTQDNSKTVLAYSSISQMGIMTLAVGAGLRSPEGWPLCWAALMLYATHHALTKSALFLSVGTAGMKIKSEPLRALRLAALLLPALAMIGAPLTFGAAAKDLIKYPILESVGGSQWKEVIKFLLVLSPAATTLLMARFLFLVWPQRGKESDEIPMRAGIYAAWIAAVLLVVLSAMVVKMSGVAAIVGEYAYLPFKWKDFLPAILAAIIAAAVIGFRLRKPFAIPSGDLLVVYLKVLAPCLRGAEQLSKAIAFIFERIKEVMFACFYRFWNIEWGLMYRIDYALESWPAIGAVFLALVIVFFLIGLV